MGTLTANVRPRLAVAAASSRQPPSPKKLRLDGSAELTTGVAAAAARSAALQGWLTKNPACSERRTWRAALCAAADRLRLQVAPTKRFPPRSPLWFPAVWVALLIALLHPLRLHAADELAATRDVFALEAALRTNGVVAVELVERLADADTWELRAALGQALARRAGPAEVPALAPLLRRRETSDAAREALASIPGAAAADALRAGLESGDERVIVGCVQTLGARREPGAVPWLVPLAGQDDRIARAALRALGAIAGRAAFDALLALEPDREAPRRPDWELSLVAAAGSVEPAHAVGWIGAIVREGVCPAARSGAIATLLGYDDAHAAEVAPHALRTPDDRVFQGALMGLRRMAPATAAPIAAAALGAIAPDRQARVLTALAEFGTPSVSNEVMALLASDDPAVQRALPPALGRVLGAAACPVLVSAATRWSEEPSTAAWLALTALEGDGVDEAITESLLVGVSGADTSFTPDMLRVLVDIASERGASECTDALLAVVRAGLGRTSAEAVTALGNTAGIEDLPRLLELVEHGPTGLLRRRAVGSVVTLGSRTDPGRVSRTLLERLDAAAEPAIRERYIIVLGRIGHADTLPRLVSLAEDGTSDRAAAFRALGEWPTPAPAEPLLGLARQSSDPTESALRSYLALAAATPNPAVREQMCITALGLARGAATRRKALTGLRETASLDALRAAEQAARNEEVALDAAAALATIARNLAATRPEETKAVLGKVFERSESDVVREYLLRHARDLLPPWAPETWEADPFSGDWAGILLDDGRHRDVVGQAVALGDDRFQVILRGGFDQPCAPIATLEGVRSGDQVALSGGEWDGILAADLLHGEIPDRPLSRFRLHRISRTPPTLGKPPPDDAVVLFDGSGFDAFYGEKDRPVTWRLLPDGVAEVRPQTGGILTRQDFEDVELHLEFRSPYAPGNPHQFYGNSGVFLQKAYEVQILSNHGTAGLSNECAAIYNLEPPRVNMCYPPLQWQTYDITFRAARCDQAGQCVEPARITVLHNGVAVHEDRVLPATTIPGTPSPCDPGPIYIQDHWNRVQFRNIWVRPL